MICVNTRDTFTVRSTTGVVTIDGAEFCYSLEPVDRRLEQGGVKIIKETAIPRGVYKVKMLPSAHWACDVPHIIDVPQFDQVEIHVGNYPSDTAGCTLLGADRSVDTIGHSHDTITTFTALVVGAESRGEEVTWEVA